MEKVMNLLNDEKLLKDIRSGVALTLALGLGLLYFGFYEQISLDAILNFGVGALAIISMISVWIVRIDISFRAFDDEIQNNEPLRNDVLEMGKQQDLIVDYDSAIDYIKLYNKEQQLLANKILTENVISRLESKIMRCKIKEKPYDKYTNKINELKLIPLKDKTYKPIGLKQIKGYSKSGKSEYSGLSRFVYNPKTDGNKQSLLIAPLKGLGIGGAGSIPFVMSASLKTIVIYYSLLILSITMTVISRYLKVRKNTKEKYHTVVTNRTSFIKKLLEHKVVELVDTPLLEIGVDNGRE